MIEITRLEAICRQAGALALTQWPGGGHALAHWDKTPGNPVCEADLAVDAFLKRELGALLPEAGWLSEETADDPARLDRDRVWLVDPIDGTRDFIRGRAGWAVSVALIERGQPVAGVLFAPARGELWSAVAGGGATLGGVPLATSTRAQLKGARVPADTLPREDSDLVAVAKPNSIALRMAMVAAGQADLLATLRWGYEWDVAASALIAQEAGAVVSDAFGEGLAFNKRDPRAFGVLASAPAIHEAAVQRLASRAARIAPEGR